MDQTLLASSQFDSVTHASVLNSAIARVHTGFKFPGCGVHRMVATKQYSHSHSQGVTQNAECTPW